MKVAFLSLGCAKNLVNTEQMMALCREAGYIVTGEPEGADVAVVNTCGFIDSAKSEAIDTILSIAPLKEEGKSIAQTAKFSESLWLPRMVDKTQLTIAILIAVAACILIKLLMDRTRIGYEIRCVGQSLQASETAGIRIGRVMIISMLISGAIAGLLGGTHVLGVDRRLIAGFSSGYGFDGIAVAALAADSPLAVILSGIIFGALRAGSMVLNRTTGIPTEFIDVIQALIILLVAAPLLVKEILRIKERKAGKKGGRKG